MRYDCIVIGGGASGMMAAMMAAKNGEKVILLEKNEKLGKKIYITGKGRCNITNNIDMEEFQKFIPRNSKFLYAAFNGLSNSGLVRMLNELGVATKVERGGRVFPVSDKASDVIDALKKGLNEEGVEVHLNCNIVRLTKEGELFHVISTHAIYEADRVILCTGGKSYPLTGSTGDGYTWATNMGHTVTALNGSLVPLVVREEYIEELQGLSLKNVGITLYSETKKVYSDFGEMLFTHYGLSGPTILSTSFYASDYLRKGKPLSISIDLKPALSMDELDKRLIRDFTANLNKQYKNSLDDLLPRKLIPIIIKLSGIDPDKEVNVIKKEERKKLCELLKNLRFIIKGTRPIAEAIITSGGVKVSEINPKTMESKIISGLFIAGELLDVDGFTGGFNLQIAFSTGYMAGMAKSV